MITRIFLLILMIPIIALISCQKSNQNASVADDLTGYIVDPVEGSAYSMAKLQDIDEKILEEGPVLNGQRNGTWLKYDEEGRIQLLSSYREGSLNGPVLRFSKRGQIDEKTWYKENQYHGPRVTYRFGRPQLEENYFEGKLDGMKRIFQNNGNLQQEIEYKIGVQHGIYRFYDDKGNMTLDYLYEDGEKVSGGIVEPQEETQN